MSKKFEERLKIKKIRNKNKMPKIDLKKVKRIVILNMIAKTVGDSLFITPLFRIIKKNLPKSYLAITATSTNKDLFTNNPYLDEILFIKDLGIIGNPQVSRIKKAFLYSKVIAEASSKLRKGNFDLCIIITPKFTPVYLIPKLAGIKYVVGHEYKGSRSFFLTRKCEFKDQAEYPNRHFFEAFLDLLRLLGMKFAEKDKFVEKYMAKDETKEAEKIMKNLKIKNKDIVICFQAGAKWRSKQWPRKYYGELAQKLIEKYDAKVILTGSPDEYEMNQEINKMAGNRLINLCGKVSLGILPAILKKSDLVIGNDSGIMHMAGAVGIKTIVIYGSTNPKHSRVLGKNESYAIFKNNFCKPCITDMKNCKYNYKCMEMVKPKEVMEKVIRILG